MQALNANTMASFNSAFGQAALAANTTGSSNSAFGFSSLTFNTTGSNNSAFGLGAIKKNTTGANNTAIGQSALFANTVGANNAAVGFSAIVSNTSGGDNSAIGSSVLNSETTGSGNSAFGKKAGFGITTGSNNIIIGANVDAPSITGNQQLNVGNVLYGTGMYNGASVSATPVAAGKIGIGTTTPYARLSVWGADAASSTLAFNVVNSASTTVFAVFDGGNAQLSGTLTQSSDQRLKTNIQSLDASSSLALIEALNPVAFTWIDPDKGSTPQLGFIAQQVQQVFPDLIATTSATALTPDGTLGLNYIGLISPIVAAIQALDREVNAVSSTVAGFADNFFSAHITAVTIDADTGNFHHVNSDDICVRQSDGNPICITGDQLSALLTQQGVSAPLPQIASPSLIPDATTTTSDILEATPTDAAPSVTATTTDATAATSTEATSTAQ